MKKLRYLIKLWIKKENSIEFVRCVVDFEERKWEIDGKKMRRVAKLESMSCEEEHGRQSVDERIALRWYNCRMGWIDDH